MVFLMEMFFLSYVNELCMYPRLTFFKLVLPKTQNQLDKPVCFTHANVVLSYVNETMYLLEKLPFFKIHVNNFIAQTTHLVPMLSQNSCCG